MSVHEGITLPEVAAPTSRLTGRPKPASASGPAPVSEGAHVSPRVRVRALVRLMRPRQWIKNGLVVAAAGAAGALGHDDVPIRVGLACLAFCLLASGLYAINDVRDAAEDRLHPRKRLRPVAAGLVSERLAVRTGFALMAGGVLLCWSVRPLLAAVGVGYLALTLTYTLVWRHILVLDLLAIGGGFVLRAVAGGVAAPVALSRWFLLVISAAAVFMAASKRASELRRTGGVSGAGRRVVEAYPRWLLELIMAGSVAVAIVAYCVWALQLPTVGGIPWRPLTIVPFAVCLLRYLQRAWIGAAETPEDLLLEDRPLLAAAVLWIVLFVLGVHAAG